MAVLFTRHTPAYSRTDPTPVFVQEQFDVGDSIVDVTIYTDDLPPGTPTDPFHPYLDRRKGRYAITVDIAVEKNGIRLHGPYVRTTHAPLPEHTLKNGAFQKGMSITIMRDDHAYPGILKPLR